MNRNHYKILAKFAIEDILPLVVFDNVNAREIFYVDGQLYSPRIGIPRLKLFATRGTKCVCCGLEAEEFHLQFNTKQRDALQPHLALWGRNEKNEWRLFTIDHIVPKSRGGANKLYNYQVMCNVCNRLKGCKMKKKARS